MSSLCTTEEYTVSTLRSYFSAGLAGDFKGGSEDSPLLGGEDGAWPFGTMRIFVVTDTFHRLTVLLCVHTQVFSLTVIYGQK